MSLSTITKATAILCCGFLVTIGAAAEPNEKAKDLHSTLERLEKMTDQFKSDLDDALDQSSANGSNFEDQLTDFADLLEDEIDNLKEDVKEDDKVGIGQHLDNSMMAAAAINRAMLGRDFSTISQSHWTGIREDLNRIAGLYNKPALPNLVVATIVPVTVASFGKTDVKQVMDELEDSTDRFVDKFDDAWYTSISGDQSDVFKSWARALESSTDDLADNFKNKDTKDFQYDLELSLAIGDALNRTVLGNQLSADAATEWKTVRAHLNTLAGAFGYPVIPGSMQHLNQADRQQ